ncbi:hypothetical protein KW790_03385 [Candidatus Parcubacteria bacterium]|nr:hypothetical protein [Candidatus Parcubacteria bacterium]
MDPEERRLIDRALKISEENNRILHRLQRAMRWSALLGFIKVLLILAPFVIGYFYLEPYLGSISNNQSLQKALDVLKTGQI